MKCEECDKEYQPRFLSQKKCIDCLMVDFEKNKIESKDDIGLNIINDKGEMK